MALTVQWAQAYRQWSLDYVQVQRATPADQIAFFYRCFSYNSHLPTHSLVNSYVYRWNTLYVNIDDNRNNCIKWILFSSHSLVSKVWHSWAILWSCASERIADQMHLYSHCAHVYVWAFHLVKQFVKCCRIFWYFLLWKWCTQTVLSFPRHNC